MSENRFIVIVGAGVTPGRIEALCHSMDDMIVHSPTADVYIGPPPMEISLRRETIIPELSIRPLREPKKRDWEQRQRKHRRRPA